MASGDVGGDERDDIGGARFGVSLGVTWPRTVGAFGRLSPDPRSGDARPSPDGEC